MKYQKGPFEVEILKFTKRLTTKKVSPAAALIFAVGELELELINIKKSIERHCREPKLGWKTIWGPSLLCAMLDREEKE